MKNTKLQNKMNDVEPILSMPYAADVEEYVLAGLLVEPDLQKQYLETLSEEYFYVPLHRLIYSTIKHIYNEKKYVDHTIICDHLKLEVPDIHLKLSNIINNFASGWSFVNYIVVLQDRMIRRLIIKAANTNKELAQQLNFPMEELIVSVHDNVFNATQTVTVNKIYDIKSIMNEYLEELQTGRDTGIDCGLPSLDKYTGGFMPSNLVVIGARPSVGKTALGLNMARNIASNNIPVAFFSMEMSSKEIAARLASTETGVSSSELKTRQPLSENIWKRIDGKIGRLLQMPLFIDDTSGLSIAEFKVKAKRFVAEYGVKVIFVDYLQLMRGDSHSNTYREQEVSSISRALKAVAKDCGITVIALSQLNRNTPNRTANEGRPMLSDLRESGSIEQDADIVLLLHRPDLCSETDNGTKTELIVAKNRNGEVGRISLKFDGEHFLFSESTGFIVDNAMRAYGDEPEQLKFPKDYFKVESE